MLLNVIYRVIAGWSTDVDNLMQIRKLKWELLIPDDKIFLVESFFEEPYQANDINKDSKSGKHIMRHCACNHLSLEISMHI